MKLERATEVLENYLRGDEPDNAPDLPAAIRLGIEALKRLEKARKERRFDRLGLLPGETED